MKSYMFHGVESEEEVAPYAGAWIEIDLQLGKYDVEVGRPLRGGVD